MRSRFGIIPGVRKMAVLRANGIGDLMFALPALESLRRAYPHAEIVLLASDWHRDFLGARTSSVDRVEPVPPSRGVREEPGRVEDAAEMASFFERMRGERFDLAVQLHGGGRHSNPFVLRLGARISVGLRTPDAPPLDRWIPYVYFQSEIIRYLEVASLAGASAAGVEPSVEITARDLEESAEIVPPEGRRFAVLNPSASDPRRRWPADKFAAVGAALRASGLEVFVTGIERDRELVQAVVVGMDADVRADLSGLFTLGGLAGFLSRAAIVISNDSGPLHLAAAVGAATVGIYWCGNVITAAPVTRSRHRPVMSWRLACPRCGADAIEAPCTHTDSFVADVRVEEVTGAAFDLLGQIPHEQDETRPGVAETVVAGETGEGLGPT